jgi:hypothetical protein
MKITTLGLAAAVALLMTSASIVEAGQFHVQIDSGGSGRGFNGRFGGIDIHVGPGYSRRESCHLIRTVEVHRRTERRQVYDERGRRRICRVTVVTYEDHYSNGSVRTYTRTYS